MSILMKKIKRQLTGLSNLFIIVALFYLYFEREHYRNQLVLFDTSKVIGRKLVIIIPFTDSDISLLTSNLQSWSLSIHPCKKQLTPFIDLVFYHNRNLLFRYENDSSSFSPSLSSLSINSLLAHVRSLGCFGKVEAIGANLNPDIDAYPIGTSIQFFKLWSLPFLYSYDYFYWSEPDNRPCKKGWLQKLYQLATGQLEENWWMIGTSHLAINSDHDGSFGGNSILADHINGNALYKIGDEEFTKFIERVEEEFTVNKSRFLGSFDIAIWMTAKMIMQNTCNNCIKEENENEHEMIENRNVTQQVSWWSKHKYKFIYTSTMVNLYRTKINFEQICNEKVYFIHGRNVDWNDRK